MSDILRRVYIAEQHLLIKYTASYTLHFSFEKWFYFLWKHNRKEKIELILFCN